MAQDCQKRQYTSVLPGARGVFCQAVCLLLFVVGVPTSGDPDFIYFLVLIVDFLLSCLILFLLRYVASKRCSYGMSSQSRAPHV